MSPSHLPSPWKRTENALEAEFEFADFTAAWAFMGEVAAVAERMDHHPDWRNVYNRVEFTLSTHSAGGVTDKDEVLAGEISRLAEKAGAK